MKIGEHDLPDSQQGANIRSNLSDGQDEEVSWCL